MRAAALAAMAEAAWKLPQPAPRNADKLVVTRWRRSKSAVANNATTSPLFELPAPDAADALALALAHAQQSTGYSLSAPKRI